MIPELIQDRRTTSRDVATQLVIHFRLPLRIHRIWISGPLGISPPRRFRNQGNAQFIHEALEGCRNTRRSQRSVIEKMTVNAIRK